MEHIWIHITSGQGPAECCWVVAQLMDVMEGELQKTDTISGRWIESSPGPEKKTFRSALLSLNGDKDALHAFTQRWQGTIQWIGQSTFRTNHKRKNWFVGIQSLIPPSKPVWNASDLKVETMRASGAGGQHVNKTESAVRITHQPTGWSAVAQEERSQHLNRKLALARLAERFKHAEEKAQTSSEQTRWLQHHSLERGNPSRTFTGPRFKEI